MLIADARDPAAWDAFLNAQQFRPFLQSWTMGEVYRDTHQEPIRLEAREGESIIGICQAILVPARRGRHLSVPYGPLVSSREALDAIVARLKEIAREKRCTFIRMSPFWAQRAPFGPRSESYEISDAIPSPLHLLAEHLWYLPLRTPNFWNEQTSPLPEGEGLGVRASEDKKNEYEDSAKHREISTPRSEEEIFKQMRSTARNLIRRAEKDGVTIQISQDPVRDLPQFLTLHDETRKRHGFTPYTDAFFRAQVAHFAPRNEPARSERDRSGGCTLYLARYQGETVAASIHMHMGGETSYHHGASAEKWKKIPASYLLQWTAIQDALKRGDHIYNFWGIAPQTNNQKPITNHPFAGVTLFKTGFGGELLNLVHCFDLPLTPSYKLTRAFENLRKWKRGF
ncbi:peptidoglycan bridge formation glycyltransferase FemA/FemB family protein [Candidatus Peregrinibacteria bacterium]|nr:peptidoglycan bridge formation glycyltransferase FemA/FemB family protein [Candidatus Peregrinibacteria bacterium]